MQSICSRCEKSSEIMAAVNEFLLCASCFKKVQDEMDLMKMTKIESVSRETSHQQKWSMAD